MPLSASPPGPAPAHSPSFTDHSSGSMADTAARVVNELANDPDYLRDNADDIVLYSNDAFPEAQFHFQNDAVAVEADIPENSEEREEDDDDRSFEFPKEIFNSGQIGPLFPVFNTDLVFADTDWRVDFPEIRSAEAEVEGDSDSIRLPLRKLMISERQSSVTESASCSSSEADDLEGLAPGTYCVWDPSKQEMRKKSKSMGSSKRWRFRDLLYRSQSDGGHAPIFVLASKQQNGHKKSPMSGSGGEAVTAKKAEAGRESDRKRSQSPYRQDPVGFFARMNGLSRTIQPF